MKNKRIPVVTMAVLLFSIIIAVAGCLTTTATTERSFLRYENSDTAVVFQASMRALNDIGFAVTASDAKGGMIVAERSAFTVGLGFYRFNIFVTAGTTGGTEVEVHARSIVVRRHDLDVHLGGARRVAPGQCCRKGGQIGAVRGPRERRGGDNGAEPASVVRNS